ncbi:MAG: hypothetical protein DMF94_29665 [Acidobacteria bacterium]|nr:MAG: hypothetical protein DMF94_29665 [Acidobacteriota bacterium]
MKKFLLVTAAIVAAVAVLVGVTLPPRRLALAAPTDGTIPGIVHVHTNRSDGLSPPDEIAAAAARAGLKFVVFTDHGDATRRPDPPVYRSGVLCLDGVEISTTGGHYVALDMPASPYPLHGEARDVVEDVRRLGGFGIAAHPDSPKPQLRWQEWTAPFDGIELLNPDTSWRLWTQQATAAIRSPKSSTPGSTWHARRRLAAALLDYPFRPAETIAGLIQASDALAYRWAALATRRRVVTLAGIDAHARLDLRDDPSNSRYALPLPGYEPSFRVMSIHVRPDRALSGIASVDAAIVMRAIRGGHSYTAIDGIATPASFALTATNEHGTVHEGDELGAGGPVRLRVRSNAPPGFTTKVWNGATELSGDHHEQDFTVPASGEPAVYWVEILSTDRPSPVVWIRSNAIYVRGSEPPARPPTRSPAAASLPIFDGRSAAGWRVEHDPTSLAAVETAPTVGGAELRFRYGLSGGASVGQVAALAFDTPRGTPYDRLTFSIRAEHPMRISVQLRGGEGQPAGDRWQRAVYVDTVEQQRTVYFDDLTPVGETHASTPALESIRSLLFVVDATHTKMGDSGRIWIKRAELQRQ